MKTDEETEVVRDPDDTNPITIDLHEYQDNSLHTYEEGRLIRKQLGDTLLDATSVKLVNLLSPEEASKEHQKFVCPTPKFLVGLFGDLYRRTSRFHVVTGPDWLTPALNATEVAYINGFLATKDNTLKHILTDLCGNPYQLSKEKCDLPEASEYNYEAALYAMVENLETPRVFKTIHDLAKNLVDWLDENEDMYLIKMREYLGSFKGRWIRIRYGSDDFVDDEAVCPKMKYGDRTITVVTLYCKIGGPSMEGIYGYKKPIVSDPDTPVFCVGYDTKKDPGEDSIYPIFNGSQPVLCRLTSDDDDEDKVDRWSILRKGLTFPAGLRKMYDKGNVTQVYDAVTGNLYDFQVPEK